MMNLKAKKMLQKIAIIQKTNSSNKQKRKRSKSSSSMMMMMMIAIFMTKQAVNHNTMGSRKLHPPVKKKKKNILTLTGQPLMMSKRIYCQITIMQKNRKKRTTSTQNLQRSQRVVIRVGVAAAVAALTLHLS